MPDGLFVDLVVVYTIALGVILVAGRAGVPAIIALIGTGVITGPSVLRIVSTPDEVQQLSEIGVVLLLFTVGLDFPIETLRHLWRPVLVGGSLQIAGTAALAGALAWAGGVPPMTAMFIGAFIALSSTAIVLKELARRDLLDSPAGRLSTGVLLFQDLCVVLLLLAGPILAGTVDASSIPGVLGRAVLALALIAAIARFAMPVLFRLVTTCGQREAFPLAVLVGSVGLAAIGASLGVSMALGAFLSGLVLGGSEFSHQAHAEVRPLRDLLTSLFFISLGMLINMPQVIPNLPLVVAIAAVAIAAKVLVASLALAATGVAWRVGVVAALYLAQVGEFSFVLGREALAIGALTPGAWQILLPASILTMLAAPSIVGLAPSLGERLVRAGTVPAADVPGSADERRVIILGFGIGGRIVAAALKSRDLPYLVIDLNGASVREARAAGEPIIYGDATAPDTLLAAGITQARALVMVLSDPDAALKVVRTSRQLAPDVPVLVRARYRSEAARLEREGAIAVAEELEASLEVLGHLLMQLDVPLGEVDEVIRSYRKRADMPTFHMPGEIA